MGVKIGTRKRLANAARRVFARKGYHTATLDDIARSARIAKGTVYLYIRHKDDLITLIAEQEMTSILSRLEEISDSISSPSLRLRSALILLVERVMEYERTGLSVLMRDLYGVKGKVLEQVQQQKQKIIRFFTDLFEEGIRQKEFRQMNVPMASFIIFSLVGALVHKEMRLPIESPQSFVDAFLDILMKGVESQ